MARDRRRPTNRHVRRPHRAPIHRPREPEPEASGLADAIDEDVVQAALRGPVSEPATWLSLTMLLTVQTEGLLLLIQSVREQSEQAVKLAWTQAGDAPHVLHELRETSVTLLALRTALEAITEPVDPDSPV